MRWFWIDRFTEFVCGDYAVSQKTVSLSEDHLHDFPGFPPMPPPLIIEGIAQTGGLLVSQLSDFRERVVLAKVGKATFHRQAFTGQRLQYRTDIVDVRPDGAIIQGAAHVDDEPLGEFDVMFAYLDERFPDKLFTEEDFFLLLTSLRVFEVGRLQDGSRLEVPSYMRTS